MNKCSQNEVELRNKIDECNSRILKYESIITENKEQLYLINTENTNLKTDLKNLSNMERALRSEVSNVVNKREELENTLQQAKDKMSEDALLLRRSETEKETLQRQIMSMENTISIASKQVEDLKNETHKLKENLITKEKENIVLLGALDQKDIQLKTSQESLQHSNSLLETYKQAKEKYENESKSQYESMIAKQNRLSFTPDYPSGLKVEQNSPISKAMYPYDSPLTPYRNNDAKIFKSSISFTPRNGSFYPEMTPVKDNSMTPISERNTYSIEREPSLSYSHESMLNQQLNKMISEKQKLEYEYARLPIVINKSANLTRKKENLESRLDMIDKAIESRRRELREIEDSSKWGR